MRIRRPKLRLGKSRNNHKFSLIEDSGVASYFDWLTASCDCYKIGCSIWSTGAAGSLPYWETAARMLQIASKNLVPAGLRAGGVTHHFLIHQNVGLLRRRARWQSERTKEHHLHEATYALQSLTLPREAEQRILKIDESAASLLDPPPSLEPPVAMRCTTVGGLERVAR